MDRTEPRLITSVERGVATVVIANPAKRNAMTTAMWRSLPELLERLAADPAVRVLVLTGAGDTFCAGADISTLREIPESAQGLAVAAEEALAAFPRPTLAAVRGYCVGGGSQLAAACDLRFAEEGAFSGSPRPSSASSTPPPRPGGWSRSSARPRPSTCCSPAS